MQNIIRQILSKKSLSVVGLAKNTGKTETLNFLLRRLQGCSKTVAVTSIGLDGEKIDQVFGTDKPEITIYKGMIFNTVEKFFNDKTFDAEILNISNLQSSNLGKLVTAKAKETGKIILSGAADTFTLQKIIAQNAGWGADITIVDGATSRLSLASPAVTDALILATGAAYSANIEQLVRKTKFVVSQIALPLISCHCGFSPQSLEKIENGLWCATSDGIFHNISNSSFLLKNIFDNKKKEILKNSKTIFCAGAVSDNLLNFLRFEAKVGTGRAMPLLIVRDFTRFFISPQAYNFFVQKGGKINVLHRTNLLAITINPTSPDGILLNSQLLQQKLRENIDVDIFNVREI